jgi:hypothetical protein
MSASSFIVVHRPGEALFRSLAHMRAELGRATITTQRTLILDLAG